MPQVPQVHQSCVRTELSAVVHDLSTVRQLAVFFNRLGELRDRTFENQRYRASGLNLVVAAIVLWNTVYLERAIKGLREAGQLVKDSLLTHLSPLGWEYINLTGDYVWHANKRVAKGGFRPLRKAQDALSHLFYGAV